MNPGEQQTLRRLDTPVLPDWYPPDRQDGDYWQTPAGDWALCFPGSTESGVVIIPTRDVKGIHDEVPVPAFKVREFADGTITVDRVIRVGPVGGPYRRVGRIEKGVWMEVADGPED